MAADPVTWTKLTEDFDQHPKIVAAGPAAELLHIHALIYSNRHLTDGFVPGNAVKRLTPATERRSVERLVQLGIWLEVDGGYQIHDFLDYQPSRAKVLANREQKASAGQAGGQARAKAQSQAKSKPVSVSVTVDGSVPVTEPDSESLLSPNGDRPPADPVESLFAEWAVATGRQRTALTSARRRKVSDRRKEGFTFEELELVVTVGWQNDPWNERPLHNQFEILLRDASQVETFLKYAKQPPRIDGPLSALEKSGRRHLEAAIAAREKGE